jgi:hypothetical protein
MEKIHPVRRANFGPSPAGLECTDDARYFVI